METVTDFIFLGSKITADGDCSPEIKRCLLLEIKAITILDSILKSRDATLLTKVRLVKATRIQSLGWEDALEERRATHSTILTWRIPWTV